MNIATKKTVRTLFLLSIMFTIPIESKISIPNLSNGVSTLFAGKKKEEITHKEFENIKSLELFCTTGNISIHTWKQPNMIIEIKKHGTTQQLTSSSIDYINHESLLQIKTITNDKKHNATTHMNIIVPEYTDVKVGTKQGNISIKNLSGNVAIETELGNIEIVDGTDSTIAQTTHGNIFIQQETIPENSSLIAKTTHGNITLQIPQHANCNLQAQTKHGKIDSDLFITLQERTIKLNDETYKQQKRNIKGTITKNKSEKLTGTVDLTTDFGMIKIKPYI